MAEERPIAVPMVVETSSIQDLVLQPEKLILNTIEGYDTELRAINKQIFNNPELGYAEFQAHNNIVSFLRFLGFSVIPHAFGLATSFSCEVGNGGRIVVYNAEYDALPGIGHACGHNLIATSSIAAFLGLAAALKASAHSGRVRLYGTPAEESGGGKLKLINAGAYKDVDACLMVHPGPSGLIPKSDDHNCRIPTGAAYFTTLAKKNFNVTYTGKPAHAAMAPYQGINALDAVVLAYNGVSMLRQQIRPSDRIHSVILDGGSRPNIITSFTKSEYYVRSATMKEATALEKRVRLCLDGAATATGCEVEYEDDDDYADLRPNRTICTLYTEAMSLPSINSLVVCDFSETEPGPLSTDQGNVSHLIPTFHGGFAIPCPPGAYNHTPGFTACAGTDEAHDLAVIASKGMAIAGWKILNDEAVAKKVWEDFENDRNKVNVAL